MVLPSTSITWSSAIFVSPNSRLVSAFSDEDREEPNDIKGCVRTFLRFFSFLLSICVFLLDKAVRLGDFWEEEVSDLVMLLAKTRPFGDIKGEASG